MKTIALIGVVLACAAAVRAQDFTLTGTDHLDVATPYVNGTLNGFSTADVLQGGYIEDAYVNDEALLRVLEYRYGTDGRSIEKLYSYHDSRVEISGGEVGTLDAYDNSNIAMSGGGVSELRPSGNSNIAMSGGSVSILVSAGNSSVNVTDGNHHILDALHSSSIAMSGGSADVLGAEGTSTVTLSGGYVHAMNASNTSSVGIDGGGSFFVEAIDSASVAFSDGSITQLFTHDTSSLNMTGGSMTILEVYDLRVLGPERVRVSDGSVGHLSVVLRLEGNEHLTYCGFSTPSELAAHGVQVAPGTVGSFNVGLDTYDNSSVNVSQGTIVTLHSYDMSSVDISGGIVEYELYAMDASEVYIRGGSVASLHAAGTTSVDISGGGVDGLAALWECTVTLHGYDFQATRGLTLVQYDVIDGVPQYEVLGTGLLTGKWFDGTAWEIPIWSNAAGATVRAVPEPATLAMLAVGGLALAVRRRKR